MSSESLNSGVVDNSKKNTIIFSRNRNEKQRKNVFTSLIKNDKYQKNKFEMTIFQPTFIQSNNQKNKRAITILNDYNTSSNIIKPMNSFNQTLKIINNSSLNEHSKSLNKNKTKEFSDTNIYNNSKVNIKK